MAGPHLVPSPRSATGYNEQMSLTHSSTVSPTNVYLKRHKNTSSFLP